MPAKKTVDVELTEEQQLEELRQQISEFCLIKDRMDALDNMLDARKKRIRLLMEDIGIAKVDADAGSAAFTERRSFKVADPARLVQMFDVVVLAANCKVTADLYDAAKAEGVAIDEAVTVGLSPNLSVSRARSKAARERRSQYIAESKSQAEKRINALRTTLRRKS